MLPYIDRYTGDDLGLQTRNLNLKRAIDIMRRGAGLTQEDFSSPGACPLF